MMLKIIGHCATSIHFTIPDIISLKSKLILSYFYSNILECLLF